MNHRISRKSPFLLTGACLLLLAAVPSATAQEAVPWPCTGEAFVIQDVDARLYRVDQTVTPFSIEPLCPSFGREINNLGFCRSDGLLYAVQLNPFGNDQLVQIDANCDVFPLGTPGGWSYEPRFDAGELTPDGSTMYVTWGFFTNQPLYMVSLADWQATPVTCAGHVGCVHDWAVHPFTAKLYGCDGTDGQLAEIDPVLGERIDFAVPDLPGGIAFGGAWFNAAGRLFCYRNSGVIYEIDVENKIIVRDQPGPASSRNDATACVQDLLGAAKNMEVVGPSGLPATIVITHTFENFNSVEGLYALRAEDDLTQVFGEHDVDWRFVSIWSEPPAFADLAYDGHANIQLITQNPPQSLAPSTFATVTVTVETLTLDHLDPNGEFCNLVKVRGETAAGLEYTDASTEGDDPDPDNNGSPDEQVPACVPVVVECGDCEGKMTSLTLEYLGTVQDAWIEVVGFKKTTAFEGTVQPGEVFVVDSDVFKGTLGPELDLYVDGAFNTIIHTSCSQPIYVGQIWGDFRILAGASKDGGPLCPVSG